MKKKKVDPRKPRQLQKQNAWYYLPYQDDKCIEIHQQIFEPKTEPAGAKIRISARKLLRELLAIGVKP